MKRVLLVVLCLTLIGCNPLMLLCGDDPDCPRQYFLNPITHKKVHVNAKNIYTNCGQPYMCHEGFESAICHRCITSYEDDNDIKWNSKPYKEYVSDMCMKLDPSEGCKYAN